MRAVIQRVKRAHVKVDGSINGEIGQGLLVLLGVGKDDSDDDARQIADKLSFMQGVKPNMTGQSLEVQLAEGVELDPARIGEVLVAGLRNRFPKIDRVSAEIIFDAEKLRAIADGVRAEKQARQQEIDAASGQKDAQDERDQAVSLIPDLRAGTVSDAIQQKMLARIVEDMWSSNIP